jgi:5'-methylthioadenosine/S-adenosylhomocysteine nucleosidase
LTPRPIVILTALELEYEAVREKLVRPKLRTHQHGTRFEVGRLGDGGCRVALALVGKGNHAAAVLAERAIAEFGPAALLFVGVAGALHSHIDLGDVVIATHVYAFHGATSEDDGLKSRPRVWETQHSAEQIARHVARGWPEKVRFGAIAAGEVVLNSKLSDQARWVREHYNDAMAIEMEGAGVAQAGHLNSALPVVVVRGISDRADGTKEITDRDLWQQRAVTHAASFAVALATELARSLPDGGRPTTLRSPGMDKTTSNVTTRNYAGGNARVGVQAGQVHGNIWITPESGQQAGLAEKLAAFREQLEQAHLGGALDDDDYVAAESELAVADKSLAETPPDRRTLKTALKRLLGLVSDVTELATRLTTIIDAVRNLS